MVWLADDKQGGSVHAENYIREKCRGKIWRVREPAWQLAASLRIATPLQNYSFPTTVALSSETANAFVKHALNDASCWLEEQLMSPSCKVHQRLFPSKLAIAAVRSSRQST
jgi:hypothetical protein